MKEELNASFPKLFPIDFFSLECEIPYVEMKKKPFDLLKRHFLPKTASLLGEEGFADLSLGWNEEGIFGLLHVEKAFHAAFYPHYQEGDSLELFIDTRNIKDAGFATRFCHHFLLLPSAVNGICAKELTRFRSEDRHDIEESLEARIEAEFLKKSYFMRFFIPKESFCGYEPATCRSLGFTYRINRSKGASQHFSVSSSTYPIEQQPSLWATLHLKKG